MQIVIDIPKEEYKRLVYIDIFKLRGYIESGKQLPKGHGDLVDRDKINDRFYGIWKELESYSNKPTYKELLDRLSMCLDTALPIIEADKESEG